MTIINEFTPLQQQPDGGMDDLMSIDQETQPGNTVRLSQAQKFVLSKLLLPDATPLTSYEQTSGGRNIVANRETLEKLGMVEVAENSAVITDKGREALKQEGLTDDMGGLTPQGEKYAYAKDLAEVGEIASGQQDELGQPTQDPTTTEPPIDKQMSDMSQQPDSAVPKLEAWSMITDMQTELSEKHFMRKHGKKL